jgi:xylulose-5-phosphate/fructose-6-phosphate phosphoketolase
MRDVTAGPIGGGVSADDEEHHPAPIIVEVDGQQVEGTFGSHQVPLPGVRTDPSHLAALDQWLRSYQPEELFDEAGRPVPELLALSPVGARRMSANPHANGGVLLRDLELPDWHDYAVDVPAPGTVSHEATRVLGTWLRDIVAANPSSFLITASDELASNRLQDVRDVTGRRWDTLTSPGDDRLDPVYTRRHGEDAPEIAGWTWPG